MFSFCMVWFTWDVENKPTPPFLNEVVAKGAKVRPPIYAAMTQLQGKGFPETNGLRSSPKM